MRIKKDDAKKKKSNEDGKHVLSLEKIELIMKRNKN
jgi:hypothetical protein